MAEAVVPIFLSKLQDVLSEEANLLRGVEEQVRLLQHKLDWMLLFIRFADAKRRQDERVNLWVRQIRDVIYHAEDIIDEFMVKISQQRLEPGFGLRSFTRCMAGCGKLTILHRLAGQIEDVNKTVNEISNNKSDYGIPNMENIEPQYPDRDSIVNRVAANALSWVYTSHIPTKFAQEAKMVGNEAIVEQLKSVLTGGNLPLTIVSIMGMGGTGKTLIADTLYKCTDVRRSFDCFVWVNISRDYQMKEILQEIVQSLNSTYNDEETVDELKRKIYELLKCSKYLIVLDNIMNDTEWQGLETIFPREQFGSRLLLTTRNRDLATVISPANSYVQEKMEDDKSWDLFIEKAFRLGRSPDASFMEHIGKEIREEMVGIGGSSDASFVEEIGKEMVRKFERVPITVVLLGGLLSTKHKTYAAWSKVRDCVNSLPSHQNSDPVSCLEMLALSYYDLPYYLKSCFLYMGLFPGNYEICSSKLIQYWIAEGFIRSKGGRALEDIAEEYLVELIHRNMVQVARRKISGRVKTCRIHDLLRSFCIKEAKEDHFFEIYSSIDSEMSNNVRRLTIYPGDPSTGENVVFQNIRPLRHIRSVICFNRSLGKQFWRCFSRGIKLLRVLELHRVKGMSTLPRETGELIHLKYLGLRETGLQSLPNSITRLVNLQTLDLRETHIKCVPTGIWMLQRLRCLRIDKVQDNISITMFGMHLIRSLFGVDNLRVLHTLEIGVGNWIIGGGLGKIWSLKKLVLKGSLVLYKKAISDSINELRGLKTLELRSSEEIPILLQLSHHYLSRMHLDGKMETLPNTAKFSFPRGLVKLSLSGSQILDDTLCVIENLHFLRVLHLGSDSFIGAKILFSTGGFLSLEVLKLKGLKRLEKLTVEEGALRCLTHLGIDTCQEMLMPAEGLEHLQTLEELEVHNMPKTFVDKFKAGVRADKYKIVRIITSNLT